MTAKNFGLHRTRKLHIKKETTFGTPVVPAATDAVRFRNFNIDMKRARTNRDDVRQTRSLLERITGKKTVTWNLECYVLPSGASGDEPDIGGDATNVGLLQGVFSSFTATAEGIYALQAGQAALPFFTMFHQTENLFGETLVSAWVESFKLSGSGGDPPMFSFEGGAADYGMAATGTTTANAGTANTSLGLKTNTAGRQGEQDSFTKHAFVTVEDQVWNDRVTAIALAAQTATLTLSTAQTWAVSKEIRPASLAETGLVGAPVSGVAGSFTIDPEAVTGGANPDSAAVNVMSYEINVKNNIAAMDDEAFQETVTDFVPGFREVSGAFKVKMRKDWVYLLGQRNNFRLLDLAIVLGDTATKKLTVDLNKVECEFEGIDWQSDREAVMSFNFVALASSSLEDEVKLSFT